MTKVNLSQIADECVSELASETRRKAYKQYLANLVAVTQAEVEKFAKALVENPRHAIEWSDEIPRHAARISFGTYVLAVLDNEDVTVPKVKSYFEGLVVSKSRFIHNRSTSPAKNRLEDCELAVWAEELATMEQYL